jgi:predicted RNA binding protein YcfA (HicA-like mRNA interferase family)
MKCSELLRLLHKDGWIEIRQSGSHIIMRHPTKIGQIPVPYHGSKEAKKGMLTVILKQAAIKTNKR